MILCVKCSSSRRDQTQNPLAGLELELGHRADIVSSGCGHNFVVCKFVLCLNDYIILSRGAGLAQVVAFVSPQVLYFEKRQRVNDL